MPKSRGLPEKLLQRPLPLHAHEPPTQRLVVYGAILAAAGVVGRKDVFVEVKPYCRCRAMW